MFERAAVAVDGPGCASKPWVVLQGEMKRNPALLSFDQQFLALFHRHIFIFFFQVVESTWSCRPFGNLKFQLRHACVKLKHLRVPSWALRKGLAGLGNLFKEIVS
jgi:hypothetical protein